MIVLVLGGARSGKSEVAEELAAGLGPAVTYLATGWRPDGSDPSWAARVAAHRLRRPTGWTTVEVGADLGGALRAVEGDGPVLVDSLGTWVAGVEGFAVDLASVGDALADRSARAAATVLVSDEVGLGVSPPTPAGNAFRDALGEVNRAVATLADEAWLIVAGRRLRLE